MKTKNLNENRFYVYTYLDPRKLGKYVYGEYSFDYEPFYVGKGTGYRKNGHLKESSLKQNSHKNNKIKKIIKETNKEPIILELQSDMTEQEALNLEEKLVTLIGRFDLNKGPLTNLTNAGEKNSGAICSEELRIKRSERIKGNKNPNCIKPPSIEIVNKRLKTLKTSEPWNKHIEYNKSDEGRKIMSELLSGDKNHFYGKHHSVKTKKTLKRLATERMFNGNNPMNNAEYRKKVSESKKKKIVNLDGIIFNSITETGQYYNVSSGLISMMLTGKQKNRFDLSYYIPT